MNNIYNIFCGIIIGMGVILPGVSGSVIAIMLGIYNKIIFLLNDKEKNILIKFKELFPIILGLLVGVILFGNILLYFYKTFEIEMCYIFIGLILGGLPILNNEIKSNKGKINYIYLFTTFIISILLLVLPNLYLDTAIEQSSKSFFVLLIAGFLYISGKIIPGVSSSFFMIILGLYDYILSIMANPFSLDFYECIKLIPFIIGIIIGFLILIKLINYLLNNYFSNTYSAILGFVLGSILAIFPGFKLQSNYIIATLLAIISFYFTYKMSKKGKN